MRHYTKAAVHGACAWVPGAGMEFPDGKDGHLSLPAFTMGSGGFGVAVRAAPSAAAGACRLVDFANGECGGS